METSLSLGPAAHTRWRSWRPASLTYYTTGTRMACRPKSHPLPSGNKGHQTKHTVLVCVLELGNYE